MYFYATITKMYVVEFIDYYQYAIVIAQFRVKHGQYFPSFSYFADSYFSFSLVSFFILLSRQSS